MLAVSALGAFLAFLDSTIVNVAFPDIQQSFPETSLPALSWVLSGYNIVLAALLVVAGRSADLIGRRRIFISGVLLFVLSSVACALAPSVAVLIAFRLVQGAGAALLIPASLGLVVDAFPVERRAHAIGLWGATAALASGLGPPAGGALIALWDWRLTFLVNLPVGVVTIVLARRVLVEKRASGGRALPDLRGALLLGAAVALLTLALVQGREWGWSSVPILLAFGGAAAAFAGYVLSSRSHPAPLIDPVLLRQRSFVVANTATLAAAAGWFAYGLAHVLWLRYVWNYSLFEAGLAVAPGAVVAAVVAAVLGRVGDRFGLRPIIVVGSLIWAVALGWFYPQLVPLTPDFAGSWLIGQLITGVGVGATMPMLGSAALAAVPGQRYATASAVNSSVRQIGAVLGVSALVIIVGTPDRATIVAALRTGWQFSAVCFVIAAVVALALGRRQAPRAELPVEAPGSVPVPARPAPVAAPARIPASPAGTLFDVVAAVRPAAAERLDLAAGSWLFEEGAAADGMYLVESGRVEVVAGNRVVRHLGAGELVGELAVLTGGTRSAGIRAVRDTVLSRISAERFRESVAAEPAALLTVATEMARRLASATPPPRPDAAPAVVTVVGVGAGAPVDDIAAALTEELAATLSVVRPVGIGADGLERAEREHDVVVLAAAEPGEWWEFCLRSADRRVVVLGSPADADPAQTDPRLAGGHLVWGGAVPTPQQRLAWHAALQPLTWHHVDPRAPAAGTRPLARRLARRSPALVLAGGGARALAHLGVLDVLEESGLEFDRVAGTSFGSLVAALWAMGATSAEIDAALYDDLLRGRPFGDATIPLTGLVKGERVRAAIRRRVGDTLIEELDREFSCVSVDLLTKKAVVHRSGSLADAVLASARLPGIFSPLRLGNALHIDGTVLDNLPVDAVAGRDEGPIVAVDIGAGGARRPGPPRMPSLGETVMRSLLLGGAEPLARARSRADLVITPRVDGVGMLEFHEIDTARAAGRAAAEQALPELTALLPGVAPAPLPARASVVPPLLVTPTAAPVSTPAPVLSALDEVSRVESVRTRAWD